MGTVLYVFDAIQLATLFANDVACLEGKYQLLPNEVSKMKACFHFRASAGKIR